MRIIILISDQHKRQNTQDQPDQNDIKGAACKIGISHEADAADDHHELLALFPVGQVAQADDYVASGAFYHIAILT
jgi:hypothetical protein